MGKIVEKKKKKKGRPSLIDIQKRNLRLLQQQQNPNPNSNSNSNSNSIRRFTRRNPDPDDNSDDDNNNSDDDDDEGNRRERKINHVRRLHSNQRSSVNSPYLDLGLYGSDSNEEDENGETPNKKRKINAAGDGSASKKGEKQNSAWKATEKQQQQHIGTPSDSGPTTTPLPDKKLLAFILDRLQKKDTYGVYSEPVDPEELPDYFDIVDTPMDFGTVRKKLEDGVYTSLEQFESDVFLISSNAMQYNAPDTIYFRQARTIHELAKKDFQNLRQDSDHEQEQPKVVRRGRPPKNLKKLMGERDSLDATKGAVDNNTAALSNSYNLRKGRTPDRYLYNDGTRRNSYGARNNDAYNWLPEYRDDFSGSSLKGYSMKYGKKQQSVLDESRRNTYNNSDSPVVGSESSVLSTFDGEIKQLLPVGLHTEHGYARSLARYAANLGPVAWKVASKKIQLALPPGTKFGPGWVGDDEAPSSSHNASSSSSSYPCAVPHQQLLSSTQSPVPPFVESSTFITGPPVPSAESKDGGFGLLSNGPDGMRPPFQINPGVNGVVSGGFGPNMSQMGKQVRPDWSAGNLNSDVSVHSRILDMVSNSNFINSMPTNHTEMYNSTSTINSAPFTANSVQPAAQAHWNGLLLLQNPGSIQPDLNVRFQSPGSPNPSPQQPDLALQL
ncbi:hypothetical protein ACHQM5_024345 [Ranunculus cassubicifolius]